MVLKRPQPWKWLWLGCKLLPSHWTKVLLSLFTVLVPNFNLQSALVLPTLKGPFQILPPPKYFLKFHSEGNNLPFLKLLYTGLIFTCHIFTLCESYCCMWEYLLPSGMQAIVLFTIESLKHGTNSTYTWHSRDGYFVPQYPQSSFSIRNNPPPLS